MGVWERRRKQRQGRCFLPPSYGKALTVLLVKVSFPACIFDEPWRSSDHGSDIGTVRYTTTLKAAQNSASSSGEARAQ
jgi:hypothetical protein